MIPIGDEGTPGRRGFPIVNITIIVLNILVFLLQLGSEAITYGWSLIPREIMTGMDLVGQIPVPGTNEAIPLYPAPLGSVYLTLLTSMFMHGGLLHIGSNMLFLFIFGDNVEDNMGSLKYLIFYLLCGFAASFTQIFLGGTDSVIPNLGASGAIAGVLGAYVVLFPQARVRTLIPILGFITVGTVPALFMIGIWILTQLISVFALGEQGGGSRGWGGLLGAHRGLRRGLAAGVHLPRPPDRLFRLFSVRRIASSKWRSIDTRYSLLATLWRSALARSYRRLPSSRTSCSSGVSAANGGTGTGRPSGPSAT